MLKADCSNTLHKKNDFLFTCLHPRGVCVLCVSSLPTVELSLRNHYGFVKENKRVTKPKEMTFQE